MRVPLAWLRELCPTDAPAEDLARLLTARGVKVESVLRPWSGLSGVVVARVMGVEDHPRSDRLAVTRVTDGSTERQVLAGVRNFRAGDLVPLAPPGARVPALPEPLQPRTLRGLVSDGMLCSPRELGVSAEHGGILVLPGDVPLGADVAALYGLDDAVLDIEVKANRPDLLSILGVAREAAAATGTALRGVPDPPPESPESAAGVASVEVLDLERCPHYLARVIRGVSIGRSPIAVQARLTACGMRPISNVVDATNYAMLEIGQPMHPFDLALLDRSGIVVRRARSGERLVTLDDVERTLEDDDLVVADHAKAVAVAGVMGSAAAEVSDSTRDVLLESAHFAPGGVLRTARRLGLRTEASTRFERGADPEAVAAAAARAAALMAEWGGGTVLAGVAEAGGVPPRRRLAVRPARASLLLGTPVDRDEAIAALATLGMRAPRDATEAADVVEVEIPGHRHDVRREVDLIEEIARVHGYDGVPATLPAVRQPGGVAPSHAFRRRVREALVRAGLREALNLSFASDRDLELAGSQAARAVRVANPLDADAAWLRTSLVPALLGSLARNVARGERGAALFEIGRVFSLPDGERAVEERERVAVVMGGAWASGHPGDGGAFDFFDAKGAVESLLARLGAGEAELGGPPGLEALHPARSAEVRAGGRRLGILGELHPRVADDVGVPARTSVAELDVDALRAAAVESVRVIDVSRFPPVRRDLAFLVGDDVAVGALRDAIGRAGRGLVESAVLFDVYRGDPVPAGQKNVAFSVDFRAPDRTLTADEVDEIVAAVARRVETELGGRLRTT